MSQLTDRLERDLREIAVGAHPSPSAWKSIVARIGDDGESAVALVLAPAPDRSKRPVWIAVAAAALVVITGSIAVLVTRVGDDHSVSTDVVPTIPPTAAPFVGVWVSTDPDGSSQTMEIVRSGTDGYGVVVHDDAATAACAGVAATMTGTGLLETPERLVIAQPELICDDGAVPRMGPPPQAELANFTLELDTATDESVDSFGVVWRRAGSNDELIASSPVTVPALASGTSGWMMWPQSRLDEVRAAQELADAGDPAYTWHLDAKLAADEEPHGAEIFARFIEEELGWEEFTPPFSGYLTVDGGGRYDGVLFIRCAPGQTNPLSPLYADAPPEIRRCAPTIDDFTYETVEISVTQPERRGPSGIWVVDRWKILQSNPDPAYLWCFLYDDCGQGQVGQVAPPTDAEVTALLQAFLRARVDGEGAEQYLLREPEGSPQKDTEVPLLYATTSGAPYERSEIERVQGPVWPSGWMEYKVRLFAVGETVVEQHFYVIRHGNGQLGLLYPNYVPTTENGQSVAVPYSFLDGEVTFAAAPPWYSEDVGPTVMGFGGGRQHFVIAADPLPVRTGCEKGPAPADAKALARSLMSDPAFETTETVPVRIAGIDGLQIDGVVTAQWDTNWSLCYPMWTTDAQVFRMRLYLIDYPGESAQVLTLAVIAPEADFERVLEEATLVVESLEFHPG